MASDLKLESTRVVAEGHRFRVEGEDLEIHSTKRLRKVNPSEVGKPRRALVHGTDDQLILNCGQDYKRTEVYGPLEVRDGPGKKPPAIIRLEDGKGVAHTYLSLGIVKTSRDFSLGSLESVSGSQSVLQTLKWLIQRVAALERNAGLPVSSGVGGNKG